ncbi:MAG: hypothetical protein HYU66_24290 [Armatimonadetes bacterium]|nr:hypothetical protein [Armatimonadota bacterium]
MGTLRVEPGGYTVFVVMQAPVAAGPSWQRVMGVWSGEGNDWVKPNWILMRAGGATPAVMPPAVMMQAQAAGHVLDRVTIFGAAQSQGQWLAGDIAEVLLYDRRLGDDEAVAVERYLRGKWKLP